jgi:hypothetical protein
MKICHDCRIPARRGAIGAENVAHLVTDGPVRFPRSNDRGYTPKS